jgi:hypothetical protein
MAARHRKCPRPDKTVYTTRWAAFRAVLRDPRLVRTYRCKGHWHTTSKGK